MSVSLDLALPAQPPPFGSVRFDPLGGDGITAPASQYVVACLLAGDATGGTATITVTPDPQYVSVVDYMSCGSIGATADAEVLMQVIASGETAGVVQLGQRINTGAGIADVTTTWTPPMTLLEEGNAPTFRTIMANVAATETYFLNARVYNFRRNVKHSVPLHILARNFPRGGFLG